MLFTWQGRYHDHECAFPMVKLIYSTYELSLLKNLCIKYCQMTAPSHITASTNDLIYLIMHSIHWVLKVFQQMKLKLIDNVTLLDSSCLYLFHSAAEAGSIFRGYQGERGHLQTSCNSHYNDLRHGTFHF